MKFFTKKTFNSFLFSAIVFSSFSQEIKKGEAYTYARQIVDTMASASMHGRGYVNGGDSIAANYLKTEFQKLGLEKFTENYYQTFSFPINTFPGSFFFKIIGNKPLIPGKDFIVSSSSASANPTIPLHKIIFIDSSIFYNAKKMNAILKNKHLGRSPVAIDLKKSNKEIINFFENKIVTSGPIILLEQKKLTHSVSTVVNRNASIKMLVSDSIDLKKEFKNKKIMYDIENKFIPNHQTQNVIGYIKGSVYPDSFIVFSAHYDHLGQMGKDVYFPGANDNASGCAMLLNLAKHYSKPENRPKCSIAFIAFAGEEVGLLGSKYYTENPLFPLENIKFEFNMDIMGTGEEGITVVNGSVFKNEFDKLKQINTENNFIKDVKIRGKVANSDHYFFSEKGVKAFFIYTMGGIKAYHDIYDRPETLPLNEFENIFKLITKFGDYLQN